MLFVAKISLNNAANEFVDKMKISSGESEILVQYGNLTEILVEISKDSLLKKTFSEGPRTRAVHFLDKSVTEPQFQFLFVKQKHRPTSLTGYLNESIISRLSTAIARND